MRCITFLRKVPSSPPPPHREVLRQPRRPKNIALYPDRPQRSVRDANLHERFAWTVSFAAHLYAYTPHQACVRSLSTQGRSLLRCESPNNTPHPVLSL